LSISAPSAFQTSFQRPVVLVAEAQNCILMSASLATYATCVPNHVNPVVTAPVGAVPLLATKPTCSLDPEVGTMYSEAPSIEDELDVLLAVMVHGVVESEVSVAT
jgi:hypothetical protein